MKRDGGNVKGAHAICGGVDAFAGKLCLVKKRVSHLEGNLHAIERHIHARKGK